MSSLLIFFLASGSTLVFSKYGQVSPNEYLDPNTGKIFTVDHRKRTVVSETDKKQVLDDRVEEFRKAIQSSIETYISENYKNGKCAVAVYGADNGAITIVLSAKNVNLANYWYDTSEHHTTRHNTANCQ